MKKIYFIGLFFLTLAMGGQAFVQVAEASITSYNIVETFYEPETQPVDSIFKGTFDYDVSTHTISNLKGVLSESMVGDSLATTNWLSLHNQLHSWYDSTLGGTFAAVFKNTDDKTFYNPTSGATDFWSPQVGVDSGGVYYGFPKTSKNPGNAYALIFVPDNPLAALTQAQIDKLAYADASPDGMMGAVAMTGTSVAGYGAIGTMSGYPVSEVISAATPTPIPAAVWLLGSGLLGMVGLKRKSLV